MESSEKYVQKKSIVIAQVMSISLIWVFVVGISMWIIQLILLSLELHDMPGASVGISLVAIPVYITLAGMLTYVFIGLRRGGRRAEESTEGKEM